MTISRSLRVRTLRRMAAATLLAAAWTLSFVTPAAQFPEAQLVSVNLFDVPGAVSTTAAGINDNGDIVGSYIDAAGNQHGYLRQGSTFTTIDYPGAVTTGLTGINNSGRIIGCFYTFPGIPGHPCYFGFMLDNAVFTPITHPNGIFTFLTGIADNGDIVGFALGADGFRYRNGTFTEVTVHGASGTDPSGINASAQIVGSWRGTEQGPAGQSFLMRPSTTGPPITSTIAYPGAVFTGITDNNDAEDLVGNVFFLDPNRGAGLIYRDGAFTTVDVGPNTALHDINNRNQIVGTVGNQEANRAFVATLPPRIVLTLTGCTTCLPGAQFTVQARLMNSLPANSSVEWKIGLRLPDGTPASILGPNGQTITLPTGTNATFTILDFAWPAGLPAGRWTVESSLMEPALGKVFSRQVREFVVTPPTPASR